jgi:hypothetical protein
LSWPIRNRDALLRTLAQEPTIVEAPNRHLDLDDEESPEVECRYWLDRPPVEARDGLSIEQIPLVHAIVLLGPDTVVLETEDDGKLNALLDRFTALAGQAVPPAHPRTKVIGKSGRSEHALSWHWYLPPELADEERRRLTREQMAHLVTELWPDTPIAALGGRSPRQLARSGRAEILLRAVVLSLESSGADWGGLVDWQALRSSLGIPPEPLLDPETVDIDRIAVGRLAGVPVRRLNNDRLFRIYTRAHEWGLVDVLLEAAHEIVERPGLDLPADVRALDVYGDLASEATGRSDRAAALEWVARGRARETNRDLATAVAWDLLEVQIKATLDRLDDWVPELVAVLDRYRGKQEASMQLTARLLDMGLIELASSPDQPGEVMLDTRRLQQLISLYGPKVTTAGGYLGVSATKGEIWTPGSESRGSAIWTPGSGLDAAGSGERPKIIVSGQ